MHVRAWRPSLPGIVDWPPGIGPGQRCAKPAAPSPRGSLILLDDAGRDPAAVAQIDLVVGATDPDRTVSSAGPPPRSSSRTTVIFAAAVHQRQYRRVPPAQDLPQAWRRQPGAARPPAQGAERRTGAAGLTGHPRCGCPGCYRLRDHLQGQVRLVANPTCAGRRQLRTAAGHRSMTWEDRPGGRSAPVQRAEPVTGGFAAGYPVMGRAFKDLEARELSRLTPRPSRPWTWRSRRGPAALYYRADYAVRSRRRLPTRRGNDRSWLDLRM